MTDRQWRITARALLAIAVVGVAIPLTAHAWVGWYSRYMADDYCTAGTLRGLGFWPSQVFWYTTWSGRYSYTFLVTLVQSVGVSLARVLPGFAISLWVVLTGLAVRGMGGGLGVRIPLLAAFSLGAATVFVALDGTPSPYQSLYWLTGMITYVVPLILLIAVVGWLTRMTLRGEVSLSPASCLAIGLAALVVGGFSETVAAVQIAVLLLGAAAVWMLRSVGWKGSLALIGSALLGACLALLLIYLAPGTQIRRSLISDPVTVPQLAGRLFQDLRIFLSRTVRKIPAGLFLAVALPAAIALGVSAAAPGLSRLAARRLILALFLVPLAVAGLMLASMAPYEFAVSDYPDARVLVTSMFILVAGLSVWGFLLGRALPGLASRHSRAVALALGLLCLALLVLAVPPGMHRIQGQLPEVREFASSWERRDRALRQAEASGLEETRAASLPHMGGLAEIGYDPDEWINRCVAQTYGLKRVIAK